MKKNARKCLDAEHQGLGPGRLVRIVLAHACHRLRDSDVVAIQSIDSRAELVGPDEMAMLLASRYPSLAREHLHIPLGSGQIMDVAEFEDSVERGAFSASLKAALSGRDKELGHLSVLCENIKLF